MNTEQNKPDLIGIAKVAGLATLTEEEADRLSTWLEAYLCPGSHHLCPLAA